MTINLRNDWVGFLLKVREVLPDGAPFRSLREFADDHLDQFRADDRLRGVGRKLTCKFFSDVLDEVVCHVGSNRITADAVMTGQALVHAGPNRFDDYREGPASVHPTPISPPDSPTWVHPSPASPAGTPPCVHPSAISTEGNATWARPSAISTFG